MRMIVRLKEEMFKEVKLIYYSIREFNDKIYHY